jgi:hypothetical protein
VTWLAITQVLLTGCSAGCVQALTGSKPGNSSMTADESSVGGCRLRITLQTYAGVNTLPFPTTWP